MKKLNAQLILFFSYSSVSFFISQWEHNLLHPKIHSRSFIKSCNRHFRYEFMRLYHCKMHICLNRFLVLWSRAWEVTDGLSTLDPNIGPTIRENTISSHNLHSLYSNSQKQFICELPLGSLIFKRKKNTRRIYFHLADFAVNASILNICYTNQDQTELTNDFEEKCFSNLLIKTFFSNVCIVYLLFEKPS